MMSGAQVLKGLAWFHRWTGVALCLLFLLWFASGAVLAFVPFPSLGDDARAAAEAPFDPGAVKISPARALALADGGDSLRLIGSADGPVYVATAKEGRLVAVSARSGVRLPDVTPAQAGAVAAAFARTPVRAISGPFAYDQWVVHQHFDPWRPVYRVALADAAGTELYISARTGEVVQRTRFSERAWNWVGAVVHWLYFTLLRQSFAAWDQTVWWVSLLGLSTALVGMGLGVYRSAKRLNRPKPRWSPYHGWMKWHHILGLVSGVFVVTWIFSGWLSMDHGRIFSRGQAAAAVQARYEGAPLARALADIRPEALNALGPAGVIEFSVVDGHPLAAARGGGQAPRMRVLDDPHGRNLQAAPVELLARSVARAWPDAPRGPKGVAHDHPLDVAAEGISDEALRFPLGPKPGGAAYVDPLSGRVLVVMDDSRIAYAWIYYAVHTFSFPGLVEHPNLRRAVELVPLLAGLIFSLTGLVVAIKRLRLSLPRSS